MPYTMPYQSLYLPNRGPLGESQRRQIRTRQPPDHADRPKGGGDQLSSGSSPGGGGLPIGGGGCL